MTGRATGTFLCCQGETSRMVKMFHFTAWNDFGCPKTTDVMLHFVQVVRSHVRPDFKGPTLVHCRWVSQRRHDSGVRSGAADAGRRETDVHYARRLDVHCAGFYEPRVLTQIPDGSSELIYNFIYCRFFTVCVI